MALALLVNANLTHADEWSDRWKEAEVLIGSNRLEEASKLLKSHPFENASYFYNLGTLELKLNRFGPAVAYLERANRLKPYDADTQKNLGVAKSSLEKLIGKDRLDPASSTIESVADRLSLDEIRGILGIAGIFIVAAWFRSYLKTRNLKSTFLQPAGMLGLVGFVVCLALYWAQRKAESHPPAIAVQTEAIRSGPGVRFLELGQLEAGVKIRLLSREEQDGQSWSQIRHSQDAVGWVPTSSLLIF